MGIDAKQLKLYIIVPTLARIGLYCDSGVNIELGTCANESQMGTYLKQINGPALGIYQMEPSTHDDIWDNFLKFRPDLAAKVLAIDSRDTNNLIINLAYATAMTRIQYLRAQWLIALRANPKATTPAPLPAADDLAGMANYYKKYYNTPLGAATHEQFIDNYKRYVNV